MEGGEGRSGGGGGVYERKEGRKKGNKGKD